MRLPHRRSSRVIKQRNARTNQSRFRRILFEQFEDRRMLATAVDDEYHAPTNEIISGSAWSNDTYNGSWTTSSYDYDLQEWVYEDHYASWSTTPPIYGSLFEGNQGYFEYTPNPDADSDSFTYTICDNEGCSTGTVTLDTNAAPYAQVDEYTVLANNTLTVTSGGVLNNDDDQEDQPLTATLVTEPSHGTLTFNSDGGFSYTPNADYRGWDAFHYRAYDGYEFSDIGVAFIKVNDAPTAASDSYTTTQDTTLWWPAPPLVKNDSDPNGDYLTAVIESPPTNGSLSLAYDGHFVYAPSTGFLGTDTFTYRASDGYAQSQPATVTITVIPIDPSLVAANDGYGTSAGHPLTVVAPGVLANDSGPAGATFTAQLVNQTGYGTVTLNTDGSFSYVPTFPLFTTDSFTYRLIDSNGQSGSSMLATVTIENIAQPEITLTKFYSDAYDFKIQYAVLGSSIPAFDIAVYASTDGVTLDEQLEIAPAINTQGLHTLTIRPRFVDPQRDYHLIAVIDPFGAVEEASEANNRAKFMPGFFLATEPSGKVVLHAHDGEDNPRPMSAWRMQTSGGGHNWRIFTSKTAVAAPSTGTKYDFTGDGLVTTLDASAYSNYQQGNPTAWQRPGNRFDVNGDGFTAPSDALILINDYNAFGEHLLTGSPAGGDPLLDVSGDLVASVLDIAQILNKLNGGTGDVTPPSRDAASPFSASAAAILDYLNSGQFDYGDITIHETHFRAHGGDDNISAQSVPSWNFGGPGWDIVWGSDFDDYLDGGDQRDVINGLGGDDVIYGGAGDDHLLGESTDWGEGTWNPTPYTPAGHDTIFGGPGNDWIEGNNGNDKLYGESGNDTILGGNGNDGAWGGGGNDTMGGGDGDDGLHGDEGDDTIEGNNGVNTITGGQGDDELIGGPERDILDGNEGNDLLGGGEHHALDTSGTNLQGHYVLLYLDFSRIADMVFDDRHVTVTMTDGFGMSMTEMRNLTASASYTGGTDGSVIFPIFEPDTDYSISTTLHGGLSGGYSGSFNSSGVEYRNGVYEIIVEILSTGVNRDEDGNLPEGYTPPNPDPVEYFPHDDGGFVTYGGGIVTIAPLANDVYSGNASIQIIGGGSLGTASLNGNGTVSYVAHAHTWGLDIIKYKLSQGGQTAPLIGAIYVQVARFKEPVINIRTTVEVTPQQLGKEPQAADFAAALQDHLIATEQGEHQNAIFSFSRDRNFRTALALAGYVIFWSKDHSNATNDLDLSGLKADVVPFFFVSSYKEKERAQKVSFIGVAELANAPQLAADHERWHTDGAKPVIPLAAYSQPDLVIEKRVGYGPGAKEGSAKLRNALALFISRAQPTAAELQAACDELFGIIFNGTDFLLLGEWHDEPFDQRLVWSI